MHLALDQHHDREAAERHEHDAQAQDHVREALAEQDRERADRGGVVDGGEAGAALPLQRLDGVEEDQHADQERERVHVPDGDDAGGQQQRRIERPDGHDPGEHLDQDDRDEEIESGVAPQLAPLDARHLEHCAPEARWAGAHPERCNRRGIERGPGVRGQRPAGAGAPGGGRAAQQAREARPIERDGAEPQRDAQRALREDQGVEADRVLVVEVHALVHLEPALVDPPQAGEVHEHEHAVDRVCEPRGRPLPQEERAEHHQGERQHEHQHRLAREAADRERRSRREDQHRKREQQRRLEVVHRHERADRLHVLAVRQHVVNHSHGRRPFAVRWKR